MTWATWSSRCWAWRWWRPSSACGLRHAHPRLGDRHQRGAVPHGQATWSSAWLHRYDAVGGLADGTACTPPADLASRNPLRRATSTPPRWPTPSLAISCAAQGIAPGRPGGSHAGGDVHRDPHGRPRSSRPNCVNYDSVDELYSAIKYYLTKTALRTTSARACAGPYHRLHHQHGADRLISSTRADLHRRQENQARLPLFRGRHEEITELHGRPADNLRLAMSVFLNGDVRDARRLLEEKVRFPRPGAQLRSGPPGAPVGPHVPQHRDQLTAHSNLLSELKRINSSPPCSMDRIPGADRHPAPSRLQDERQHALNLSRRSWRASAARARRRR